jgi:hypothetical protein
MDRTSDNRLPEHALVLYSPDEHAPKPRVALNDATSFVTLLRHLDVSTVFVTQHGASIFLVHDGTSYEFRVQAVSMNRSELSSLIPSINPSTSPQGAADFLLLNPNVDYTLKLSELRRYQGDLQFPLILQPTQYQQALSWIAGCLADACGDRDSLRKGFASVRGLWTNHREQFIYGFLPADAVSEAFAMSAEEHETLWEFSKDPDFTKTLMRVVRDY